MAVYHRTQRLQIYGEKPEVTKLFGDRYRMVVRCKAARDTEAWYNDNKDQIFADFGTLYGAQMSVDGIDPRAGEAYPDMCLVSNSASYTQTGEYVISFVYETLTDTWTQEQGDTVSSTDNGLRLVERSEVAKITATAPYDEDDVGVSTITDGGKTLYLAGFTDETQSETNVQIGRVVSRWAEAGVLSQSEDKVGSQLAITIEAFGEVPSTPAGYSLARTDVSNFEGINTNRYTFLKPSILSLDTPKVGGQQTVVVQAFNQSSATVTSALSEVTVNHKLVNEAKSDYEGIQTSSYTFEVDDFDVLSATENGLKLITKTELSTSNFTRGTVGTDTHPTDTALILAGEEIDNGNTIKKRVSRWAEAGVLSKSESGGPQSLPGTKIHTWECFSCDPSSEADMGAGNTIPGVIQSKAQSNVSGALTLRYTSYEFPEEVGGKIPLAEFFSEENVRTPGTVRIGVESNTPYLIQKPRSSGRKNCTVEIYLTTTKPPTISTIANSLDNLSVGVFHKKRTKRPIGTEKGTSLTITVYNEQVSVGHQTLDGYYIESTANSGIQQTYTYNAALDADGDNIIGETLSGFIYQTYTLSGSQPADAPATTGLYARNVDIAFTALDGTVYYRVEEVTI